MARKPEPLLNELAAQLFPFCAADYEAMDAGMDNEIQSLPMFMDKAQSLCQTLLPVDQVYVAKHLTRKIIANVNDHEDVERFTSNWFCTVVLDLDSTKEFWAKMVA